MALRRRNPAHNAREPKFDPRLGGFLEKEMATHSSVLAWRNPIDRGA